MLFALFYFQRYVATAVTSVHEMENGFTIWSFNGIMLYRILKDHFFQVCNKKNSVLNEHRPFRCLIKYLCMVGYTVGLASKTSIILDCREGRRDSKDPEEVQQEV